MSETNEEMCPVADEDLPCEELRERFASLFDEIYELFRRNDESTIDAAGRAVCERIQKEVCESPILAQTVAKDMLGWSLLKTVCEKTYQHPICHDAIKFLSTANPSALLWTCADSMAIESIANNSCHCVLLPWIAENFSWIFEHPKVRTRALHLELVRLCSNGECEASVVRQFYEVYPQGLMQKEKYSGFPLQQCLNGWEEIDAGLFEWMANQYREAMSYRDNFSFSVLHYACMALSSPVEEGVIAPSRCTENTARICRFLINACPQSVRMKGKGGRGLPIHYLANRCNRPLVQDIAILLLKEYPECINVKANRHLSTLSTVPFIQQVGPLLSQQSSIEEERTWLTRASANFSEYANTLHMHTKVGEVFAAWVKHRTMIQFPAQLELVQQQVSDLRASFEGEDHYPEERDDEQKDDDEYCAEDHDEEEEDDDEHYSSIDMKDDESSASEDYMDDDISE